jgi:hypothetical protein
LQNDLITVFLFSVDLKQTHGENTNDAANHQPNEEG